MTANFGCQITVLRTPTASSESECQSIERQKLGNPPIHRRGEDTVFWSKRRTKQERQIGAQIWEREPQHPGPPLLIRPVGRLGNRQVTIRFYGDLNRSVHLKNRVNVKSSRYSGSLWNSKNREALGYLRCTPEWHWHRTSVDMAVGQIGNE